MKFVLRFMRPVKYQSTCACDQVRIGVSVLWALVIPLCMIPSLSVRVSSARCLPFPKFYTRLAFITRPTRHRPTMPKDIQSGPVSALFGVVKPSGPTSMSLVNDVKKLVTNSPLFVESSKLSEKSSKKGKKGKKGRAGGKRR